MAKIAQFQSENTEKSYRFASIGDVDEIFHVEFIVHAIFLS